MCLLGQCYQNPTVLMSMTDELLRYIDLKVFYTVTLNISTPTCFICLQHILDLEISSKTSLGYSSSFISKTGHLIKTYFWENVFCPLRILLSCYILSVHPSIYLSFPLIYFICIIGFMLNALPLHLPGLGQAKAGHSFLPCWDCIYYFFICRFVCLIVHLSVRSSLFC